MFSYTFQVSLICPIFLIFCPLLSITFRGRPKNLWGRGGIGDAPPERDADPLDNNPSTGEIPVPAATSAPAPIHTHSTKPHHLVLEPAGAFDSSSFASNRAAGTPSTRVQKRPWWRDPRGPRIPRRPDGVLTHSRRKYHGRVRTSRSWQHRCRLVYGREVKKANLWRGRRLRRFPVLSRRFVASDARSANANWRNFSLPPLPRDQNERCHS